MSQMTIPFGVTLKRNNLRRGSVFSLSSIPGISN